MSSLELVVDTVHLNTEASRLSLGERYPLEGDSLSIGTMQSTLFLQSNMALRLELVRRDGRWWAEAPQALSPAGVFFLNGHRHEKPTELRHSDHLCMLDTCLRFVEHDDVEIRNEAMEAAILSRPENEGLWRVYADWLQEHGATDGERIALGAPDAASELRQLGPLAHLKTQGALEVTWKYGFIEAVRFVDERHPNCFQRFFEPLLSLRCGRFLRRVDADAGSAELGNENLTQLLERMRLMPLPMTLESLRFHGAAPHLMPHGAWAALRQKAPRLPKRVESALEPLAKTARPAQ